jgi:hypothetical protein
LLTLSFAGAAAAQSAMDVYFGGGVAKASSSGQVIDTFGTGVGYATPKLDDTFLKFGGSVMLTPRFGFGGQLAFQPSKSDYAGLQLRQLFYDFNGIFQPVSSKRVVPRFQAGIGGVSLRYYYNQGCNSFTGCNNQSVYLDSSKHFQTHFGFGVKLFATERIFIEPQVDVHWVHNYFQFGSNWVPMYGATIGYQFGER